MPPSLWLFLIATRFRLAPAWARRKPFRAARFPVLLLAAALALALVALHSPSGPCRYQVVLTAGREHWVCAT